MKSKMKHLLVDGIEGRVGPGQIRARLPKLSPDLKIERKEVTYEDVRGAEILIEGSRETLLGLAAYLIAQANHEVDCSYDIRDYVGMKHRMCIEGESWTIVIHSLPCNRTEGGKVQ